MRNLRFTAVLSVVASLLAGGMIPSAHAQVVCPDDDRVTAEILVVMNPWNSIDDVLQAVPQVELQSAIPALDLHNLIVNVPDGTDVDMFVDFTVEQIESLEDATGNEIVDKAEAHRVLETPEGVQLSIPDLGIVATETDWQNQPAAAIVQTTAAQASYTGKGVTVAVIDTGMAFDHPTTAGQIAGPGIDLVDGSVTGGQSNPNGEDDDDDGVQDESVHHATFIAGLIRLTAPDARILPIRVLEADGHGESFALARGVYYAVQAGADVITISQTMRQDSRAAEVAIEFAVDLGVVVVAAAGNRGEEIVDDMIDCGSFPASLPQVIAVAAVDDNLVRAPFSDYGVGVDLSAPGVDLLSTFGSVDFAEWSGTSFSAPLVAGGVALLLEKYPTLTPAAVARLVRETTAPDNNPSLAGKMGSGVLDLEALTQVLARNRGSLRMAETPSGTVATWSPVLDATGYDIVRGDLANLNLVNSVPATVDLGPLSCLGSDLTATDTLGAPDPLQPLPGQGFFYVFRDEVDGGLPDPEAGTYGFDGDGHVRVPGTGDCGTAP